MNGSVPQPVIRAAETRAAGASWSAAATEAGWELRGLKRWIRNNPRLWARELGRARRDMQDAACDEAVTVLRQQLRAAEAKTVLQAAVALAARFGPRRSKARPTDTEPSATIEDLLQDDQLQQAIDATEEESALTPLVPSPHSEEGVRRGEA